MVNQYLFVEEGSLAQSDIAKIVENIKNTGTSLIMYNKGSAKPELVSITDDEKIDIYKIRTEAAEECGNYIMDNLLKYIKFRSIICQSVDEMTRTNSYKMQIEGTPDEFINRFKNFLNEIKG